MNSIIKVFNVQPSATPTISQEEERGRDLLIPPQDVEVEDDPFFAVPSPTVIGGNYVSFPVDATTETENPTHREDFKRLVSAAARKKPPAGRT